MTYSDFVFFCFTQDIDKEIIEAFRLPVMKDSGWIFDGRGSQYPESDIGHAGYQDITTVAQGIKEIQESIRGYTLDYDALGRNLQKVRRRQLIRRANQEPFNKSLVRCIAKTFYLLDGVAE